MGGRFDVVIAGGGAAGLSLALSLAEAAGPALTIALCDPALARPPQGDSRAYAIVAGARRFFDSFGAWAAMAPHAEPMLRLEITDSALDDLVRPALADFAGETGGGEAFAHMVPNGVILAALHGRLAGTAITVIGESVTGFETVTGGVVARTASRSLPARLLVAADGRASRLREQAGIAYFGWPYPQTAIVGTLHHSLPHEGVAVQHFLPAGPFAMLPLTGNRSSIVWNERSDVARRLAALPAGERLEIVAARAAGRFGTVTDFTDVATFPMSIGIARRFAGERIALVGDAAHGFHPIAGQGLNYGLRGAAALAETILDAARMGLDVGSGAVLERYEAERRPDVMALAAATEMLNRLFSTDSGAVRAVRDAGLAVVQRLPGLKSMLISAAAGDRSPAPRAFRGLPL